MRNSKNLGTDIRIKVNDNRGVILLLGKLNILNMEKLTEISIEEYKTALNFIKL
jgi:hypothetical protein